MRINWKIDMELDASRDVASIVTARVQKSFPPEPFEETVLIRRYA